VLANLLGLEKFDYETPEQVRAEIFSDDAGIKQFLDNGFKVIDSSVSITEQKGMQRIGEVPIYQADPIVRRAESLQATHDAMPPKAWMNSALLENLGVAVGERVRIKQGNGEAQLEAAQDDNLPTNCVRIASAHPKTIGLGAMFGEIAVEKL
jgi:NADH-quinone oxidoreductase subunit G